MKTKNKQLFAYLLLFFIGFALPSKAQEANFQKISEQWTLHADGSSSYHQHKELTLYTHTAMNKLYGESFISYNPMYQTLTIHDSFTKQKDGTIVRTPENAFVKVLPQWAANAPSYNHLIEQVVVHTGLELGATIFLDYTIESKAGYQTDIDICKKLRQSSPTKLHLLSITVPKDKKLHAEITSLNAKPKVSSSTSSNTYTWTLRNIAAEPIETHKSIYTGETPFLVASTATDALAPIKKQWNKAGDLQVLTLSETITEGLSSKEEKVQAIHAFICKNMGNASIPLKENGFQFRPVNDLIQSAYGTEIEKINLLHALLTAQHISATVGAITLPLLDSKALGISSVQEWFVAVDLGGKEQKLLTSSEKPSHAAMYKDYAPLLFITDPIDIETVKAAPLSKTYKLTPEAKDVKGGVNILSLPDETHSITHSGYAALPSKRHQSILLPSPIDETFTYEVSIPKGMTLATPIGNKVINNKVGNMRLSIETMGNKITVVRHLSIPNRLVSVKDYAAFRELVNAYANTAERKLLFRMR